MGDSIITTPPLITSYDLPAADADADFPSRPSRGHTLPRRTRARRALPLHPSYYSLFLLLAILLAGITSRGLLCEATDAAVVAFAHEITNKAQNAVPEAWREQGVNPVMKAAASLRIINGFEVAEQRYPYTVSLQQYREHFCGGALIASDVVITAGHCNGAISLGGVEYTAVIGRHNIHHIWKGRNVQIKKEIRHPGYVEDTVDNDFNLVILRKEVKNVPLIRLNTDPNVPAGPTNPNDLGDPMTVVGWGDINPDEEGVEASDVLMETEVYAMTNEKCEEAEGMVDTMYGPILTNLKGGITENMLCARADNTDACQGDSGGPLIKKGNAPDGSEDYLVGIVSWGLGCADEAFPGVYSRISAQYDWIRTHVCDLSMNPPDWFNCEGESVVEDNEETVTGNPMPTSNPTTAQPHTDYPTLRPSTLAPITPAPTHSPIPSGKERLLIIVELDDWPRGTGWQLTTLSSANNEEETVIYDVGIGSYNYLDANKVLEYNVLVDIEGFYKLTIFDSFANGFDGTVEVYSVSDAKQLVKEPGFTAVSGNAVSHGFYVGNSPEQVLTLKFEFDYFAHEVAYEIKNDINDVIFGLAWFDTFDETDSEVTLTIPIYGRDQGDQQYTLRLWDKGDDGICCLWGTGGYQLYAGDMASGILLKSGGGYGSGEAIQFTIEGDSPPTMPPTPNPSSPPTPAPVTPPPTPFPTSSPTSKPSIEPTSNPTKSPSAAPSRVPTTKPILPFPFEPFPETSRIPPSPPSPSGRATNAAQTPTSSPNEQITFSTSSVGGERPASANVQVPAVPVIERQTESPSEEASIEGSDPIDNQIDGPLESPSNPPGETASNGAVESIVAAANESDSSSASIIVQKQAILHMAVATLSAWALFF